MGAPCPHFVLWVFFFFFALRKKFVSKGPLFPVLPALTPLSKSDSVCHRKRAQDTAKWRLDETVASLITSLKGRRKIAFLTEAQMAVIQAAESETSRPTRLSCPKSNSRSNGSVRSSFSRTWQRFKVIVNWPYLDLQYFLIDFGYDANLHIRIMKGMIRAFV